ncbi:MAG: mechanosensitive ion channel, partial [Arthrobacter sp.]|nr:mechanosensitive ion channel [Arthrobacter sp.]
YVVVHIWDDRRLILPSVYFTTTPFENWTRRRSEVMGTVEFDLDWRAPFEAMREELKKILADTELWDKRVGILQVTDAVSGYVRVRILVSSGDSASLFDLRCLIREELVLFLQQNHPAALPHVRLEPMASVQWELQPPQVSAAEGRPRHPSDPHDSQLFTGSLEAVERSRAFSGPGEEVFEDRDKTIAAQNKPDAELG